MLRQTVAKSYTRLSFRRITDHIFYMSFIVLHRIFASTNKFHIYLLTMMMGPTHSRNIGSNGRIMWNRSCRSVQQNMAQ